MCYLALAAALKTLAQGCRLLTHLDVSYCPVGSVADILRYCSKMRVLKASYSGLDHSLVHSLEDQFLELEELDVSYNMFLRPLGVISRLGFGNCPKLRVLKADSIGLQREEVAVEKYSTALDPGRLSI